MRRFLAFVLLACCARGVSAADASRWTLALDLAGNHVEGFPIYSSKSQVQLLSRDGQLLEFSPNAAKNARKAGSTFRGYTSAEVRSQLAKELGPTFEVSGTGHYLVAHPKGQRDVWAAVRRLVSIAGALLHAAGHPAEGA